MKLTEAEIGSTARLLTVEGERLQRMKLLDMGLTPGTVLSVRRVAPMGDPIELSLRGYVLTLRKDEAQLLGIELVDAAELSCPIESAAQEAAR